MEIRNITIGYILKRRNGTIEEICDYARQRGILLPNDVNYILSEKELEVIDPLLASALKRENKSNSIKQPLVKNNTLSNIINMNIENMDVTYEKGKIVKGKIIHVAEDYLLVKFPNKETGILRKSKMSPQSGNDLTDLYRKNQSILVSIDEITTKGYILGQKDINNRYENQLHHEAKELEKQKRAGERNRMKELVESYASQFERGCIYEAEVISLSKQVAKISISGIEGYITKDELNWNKNDSVKESLFEGEIIHAVFLEYTDGKLLFGLKYLEEKPYDDKLYDFSLSDLLKYVGHDSNVFIGQAKQSGDFVFIENLYSCNDYQKGKLLIDPIYGYNLKAVVINQIEKQIIDGEYYKVVLLELIDKKKRLERNQLFQFTAEIIGKVDNPFLQDVEDAFKRHTTDPSGNISLVSMLDEVGRSGYSSNDRVFYELLQNADDAASQKGVSVNFNTSENYLIVSHDGFSFNKFDFEAITSAANGTKKNEANTTGYKGIGFKSVFLDSQKVFISSSGYNFKFDKSDNRFGSFEDFYINNNPLINKEGYIDEDAKQRFLTLYSSARDQFVSQESIPWQLEPIWVDSMPINIPSKNVTILLEIGESNVRMYDDVITNIFQKPEFMLFLRSTNRIDFKNETITRTIKRLNDEYPLISEITIKNSYTNGGKVRYYKKFDFCVSISDNAFEEYNIDLRIKIKNIDGKEQRVFVRKDGIEINSRIIPPKIAINSETIISFAIPCSKSGNVIPLEEKTVSLYAFLPTSDAEYWTFPFFLNANFILMSNRESIQGDNVWNDYLLQKIAVLIVELCKQLSLNGDRNALKILLMNFFSEESPRYGRISKLFNSAYKFALESEAFILNHKGELAKQEEIIIDKTGLSEIVGTDLFCQLLDTKKHLPSEKIDGKILEEDIFEDIELMKFDDVIDAITNNEDFNEWFVSTTDKQKKTLYKWIEDNNIKTQKNKLKSFISNLPLFHFGEEYKSCKEIESSGYIVTTEHILPIKDVLTKTGLVCSDTYFDKNHLLFTFIEPQNEVELFHQITIHLLEQDGANLNSEEKLQLFNAFRGFKEVGPATLSSIRLFCNSEGQMSCLNEMFPFNDNAHKWVDPYMISKEDNFDEIQQYLKNESDVIWKNIDVIHIDQEIPIIDIYNTYPWTDEKYTRNLIDKYGPFNDMESLLPIVESSSISTKEYFLNSIKKLELLSTSTYSKDSYEYRVLQLVLSVYSKPSDFSSKIYFDGQCIKDFSVSDDVVCDFYQNGETRKLKMSLAKLLPQYQNQSDSIDKIKALFEIKKDLDKLFLAKPMPIYQIIKELESSGYLNLKPGIWPTDKGGNALQYLFYVYYYRQVKDYTNTWVISINLEEESSSFVLELMDFLYNNKIDISISPFTYRLKKYFIDKYFDSDYIYYDEQLLPAIEKWADDEKKIKYLKDNGVQTSDCNAIQFRKLFLEDKPINFIEKLSEEEINSGIEFIATASGIEYPFVGENQKNILLSLKDKCKKLTDNWNSKKMEEGGIEWESKEYNEWIKDHFPQIFIYPGILPSQLTYKDEILLNYEDSEYDYYYNIEEEKLFVSNSKKIDDILFEVAKKGKSDLDLDDYKKLCLDGKMSVSKEDIEEKDNTIKTLEESNRRKDEIIENLQAKLKAYEKDKVYHNEISRFKSPIPTIEVGEHGGIGEKAQWEAQLEAQRRLMQEFPQWTFPSKYGKADDNGKPYNFSTIEIEDENDKTIPIVLKSYKKTSEPFKINTEEWNYLIKERAVLLIYTGTDVKRVYVRDLIRKQSSIAISFSTENLEIEDKVNAFADSLHYFNELHFDFDSFNISSRVQSAAKLYQRNKRAFFSNDNTEDDI